jgi:hypothetical protein
MKIPRRIFVIFIFGTLAAACSTETVSNEPQASQTISPTATEAFTGVFLSVPSGEAALIDGELAEGEWEDAAAVELNDGSLLYVKTSGGSLYLAVDAQVPGAVNVGILRGDELHILHSSAALGSAVYRRVEGGWQMSKNFDWCCRVSAPDWQFEELLEEEGWLSHNQYWGDDTQTEYQIVIGEETIRINVTYLYRDQSGVAYWPVDLAETDLLQFSTPPEVGDTAIFSELNWGQLEISD